jgi:hypothetical protein
MAEMLHGWRWWIWGFYVAAWTTALLMPVPDTGRWPRVHLADEEFDLKFFFSKTVHVSAYTVMTLLTAWLRAPTRYRVLLMFFLMAHATLTEMLQKNIEVINRTGQLEDVALDHVGIAVGVALGWSWWSRE